MKLRLAHLLVGATLLFGACGDEDSGGQPASPIGTGAAALGENAKQADTLVGTGQAGFESRMASLKGHPVVVNQWASWCESCRFEFPFFRAAAAKYSTRVAFLGLDSQDNRSAAEEFQRELPAGFPSIFDPDATVARELGGDTSWPTTFFFAPDGELVHTRIGAYATQELLEQDIRLHLLEKRS